MYSNKFSSYYVLKFIYIIFSIYCLGSFSIVPEHFSKEFCIVQFYIFLIVSITLIINNCKNNLFQFELIFVIAFFYTNYVYPIFYYESDNPYFSLFSLSFPENCINKGILLSNIGFLGFAIGSLKHHKDKGLFKQQDALLVYDKAIFPITNTLIVGMLLFLYPILLTGFYSLDWGGGMFIRVILNINLLYILFIIFYNYSGIQDSNLLLKYKTFFLLMCLYALFSTLIGNRGILIRLGIAIIFLYNIFIKRITSSQFFFLLVVGMVTLTIVGLSRGGRDVDFQNEIVSNFSFLEIGKDLTINNRSQYVLIDYADNYGFNYGKTFLMFLLSVIPFGQSFFLSLTGWEEADISSGVLVTDLYYSSSDEDVIGLGTNMIGDIYISFGTVGVFLLMFFLGYIVKYSYSKSNNGSPLWLLVYLTLICEAIIFTRSSIFSPLRNILWAYFLYKLLRTRVKKIN